MTWPRVTDRPMTAGATVEKADLGWVAAWTHNTSWNVTAISTNTAWYRYTPQGHLKEGKWSFICYCWTLSVFSDWLYLLSSFTSITWHTINSRSLSLHPFIPILLFFTFSDTHIDHFFSYFDNFLPFPSPQWLPDLSFYYDASVFMFTITNFLTDLYCTKNNTKKRIQKKM